jgi:DNA-directed RNA polymerase subunit H (RpoH/RPB5)
MSSGFARLQMNQKEQLELVLLNFTKMLWRRNLIPENKITEIHQKLFNQNPENGRYQLDLSGKKLHLMVYFFPVSSIKKGSDLEEFLLIKKDYGFLLVAESSKKTMSQGADHNTEVFETTEFLVDIPANPLVPHHQLLTKEEAEQIYQIYPERTLPKIFSSDIMARYMGAKVGDLLKIVRPTVSSGESVYYRRVVL